MSKFNQVVAKVKINGRNKFVHVYQRQDGTYNANLVNHVHKGTYIPSYMRTSD